jgi:5-formyltetrahydrofolate cyclo-ligase
MDKQTIRKKIAACRDKITPAGVSKLSAMVEANFKEIFFPLIGRIKRAMAYSSIRSEVKTGGIIKFLVKNKINVFLPCVSGDEIVPIKYTEGCKMTRGKFNISEPPEGNGSCRENSIGLVIVPGVAFDRRGNRIGFGHGFYDRFLEKLPAKTIKAGLCFDKQLVKKIPGEAHDIRMDYIITDKEVIKI